MFFFCVLDQIVLEPEPKSSKCWNRSRSQKVWKPGAGAGARNMSTGSTVPFQAAALSESYQLQMGIRYYIFVNKVRQASVI